MLEQAELTYINSIINSSDAAKWCKKTLKHLYAIYDKYNDTKTKECFCSLTRRKIYYKSFMEWYEKST